MMSAVGDCARIIEIRMWDSMDDRKTKPSPFKNAEEEEDLVGTSTTPSRQGREQGREQGQQQKQQQGVASGSSGWGTMPNCDMCLVCPGGVGAACRQC